MGLEQKKEEGEWGRRELRPESPPRKILVFPDPIHHLARSAMRDVRSPCGSGKFLLGSSILSSHPESLPTSSAGGRGKGPEKEKDLDLPSSRLDQGPWSWVRVSVSREAKNWACPSWCRG